MQMQLNSTDTQNILETLVDLLVISQESTLSNIIRNILDF